MINPGLTLLIRLNLRGLARSSWRRLRTLKGALTALVVAPILLLMIGSQIFVMFVDDNGMRSVDAAQLRLFLPPAALLLLLSEV
jgi:hypothetical protein